MEINVSIVKLRSMSMSMSKDIKRYKKAGLFGAEYCLNLSNCFQAPVQVKFCFFELGLTFNIIYQLLNKKILFIRNEADQMIAQILPQLLFFSEFPPAFIKISNRFYQNFYNLQLN